MAGMNPYGGGYTTLQGTADTTTNAIWPNWVQGPFGSLLSGTADYEADNVTMGADTSTTWYIGTVRAVPAEPETPEAQQAREIALREYQARQQEVMAKQAEEGRVAKERAERLLVEHLTPEQRAAYEKDRFFEVVATQHRYRIYHDGGVLRLGEDGREVASYCIHPDETLPAGDLALAKKLLLEVDESAFRRIANETLIGSAVRQ